MQYTKIFDKISKEDVAIAGGKGASLGEMTQAGIPVPRGFVVLASTFDNFIKYTGLDQKIEAALADVNPEIQQSVENASKTIRKLIADTAFPQDVGQEILREFSKLNAELVAVRSSATAEDSSTASWAGELETYLNIRRENLLDAVKKCWSSLFTPRAIFYRFEKKLQKEKVSVAVVIQKMIQSEISGISFTAHPVTRDKNQMVIEGGYGLGEAIVGGKITPDTYVLKKANLKNQKSKLKILDKHISKQEMMIIKKGNQGTAEVDVDLERQEQQKLNDAQILALARICQSIERHYKYPQDIEWALEGEKFYITQSRPITTL